MRKITLLTAALTFILASSTWATDISGKWTLTMWGAGAEESVPVVFKAAGENLTVTCTHPAFKEMTGTGTLKGEQISFNLKSSAMEIAFTGTVSGNKMEGEREVKGGGEGRAPQGGMPDGSGGAPEGAAPQGGMPEGAPQGEMPGGTGGEQAGALADAPQGAPQGMAEQGGAQAESSENWTAVKS